MPNSFAFKFVINPFDVEIIAIPKLSKTFEMRPAVPYTLYATSSKEKTGGVITFAQFEEGNLITETRNDTESDDKSNSESIMMSKNTYGKSR